MSKVIRVAAYAVCVRDGRILLSRLSSRVAPAERGLWTLPGGGTEFGEDPYDTAVREVEEETGYTARMTALLGVDSAVQRSGLHAVRVVYEGEITGGALRPEQDGSTDTADWHPLDGLAGLGTVGLVGAGLALWRGRPPTGHATAG